jgi:iron complex outermembrane receptor protein
VYAEYRVQQKAQFFGETTITAGVSYQGTVSSAILYAGDPDGDGDNTATNASVFVQVDKELWDKVSLSAGFRYEQFTVNDDEQAVPVFRAGATYQMFRATFLRASYGQGFRFPTIGERYISTSLGGIRIYPNPDLEPETSWNAEAGIKQGFKLGSFTGYADAVYFQQEFDNYIEFTFGQWATFTWADPIANFYGLGFRSLNTGGARVTGLELELTARGRLKNVDLMMLMGYTHTRPVSTTPDLTYAEPVPGPPLPGSTDPYIIVPASTYTNTSSDPTDDILKFRVEDLFRADVQAEYRILFVGGSLRYNSHVQNIDQAFVGLDEEPLTEDILPTGISGWMDTHTTGDWIVDARIGTKLGGHARVTFIVNNLTNEVYAIRPLAIEAPRSMQVQLTYAL